MKPFHHSAPDTGDEKVTNESPSVLVSIEADMKPVWLVEAGVYGAEAEPLLAEIRRQGMVAEVVPFQSLWSINR